MDSESLSLSPSQRKQGDKHLFQMCSQDILSICYLTIKQKKKNVSLHIKCTQYTSVFHNTYQGSKQMHCPSRCTHKSCQSDLTEKSFLKHKMFFVFCFFKYISLFICSEKLVEGLLLLSIRTKS